MAVAINGKVEELQGKFAALAKQRANLERRLIGLSVESSNLVWQELSKLEREINSVREAIYCFSSTC